MAVQAALRVLTESADSNADVVDREALRSSATRFGCDGGLTKEDFDELLALCGIPLTAKTVKLESIVDGVIETICHPKAQTISNGYGRPGRRGSPPMRR